MNNIKKTLTGMLIAAFAFGISAFSTIKNRTVVRYYKTDVATYPDPSDPRGYSYYSEDRCEAMGNLCSAWWDLGINALPADEGEELPLNGVSFQTSDTGHFE